MALKNTQKNTVTKNALKNYLSRLNPVKSGWDAVVESIGKKISKKKTPYGGGASKELTELSKRLYQQNKRKIVGGGASKELTDLSKSLYRPKSSEFGGGATQGLIDISKGLYRKKAPSLFERNPAYKRKATPVGGGASEGLTDLSKALYHRVNPDYIKHRRTDLEARRKKPIVPKGVNILK